MKKNILFVAISIALAITSCTKDDGLSFPGVTTTGPTNITKHSVTTGGTVISDGGATITERGIVFGTAVNPTILTNKVADTYNKLGAFTTVLSNLTEGTTYHVRAYAISSVGVAYGGDSTFTTLGTAPAPSTSITTTQTVKLAFSPLQLYTLFRFRDSSIRPLTDSATSNWDFGFIQKNDTANMFVNSFSSGPGNAGAIVQPSYFNTVLAAPSTGYGYDTTATQRAIKGSDWYNLNTALPTLVSPRTFIFKTADGSHYAKLEILNVGYVNLLPGTPPQPDTLTYTFRYTYQANGTTTF